MAAPDESEQLESEIRQLAEQNLPLLDKLEDWRKARASSVGDSRAFVIEFAGLPKAGKSAAIDNVRHYFTHGSKMRVKIIERPYRIYTPSEGVSQRTPGYLKDNLLDYNCWAGAYALQKLLEANHDNYHDLVILDRGPWDTGCWIEHLRAAKPSFFRNEDEANKIGAFFQLSHWMTQADLHVVFIVDPPMAASREKKGRLIEHQGPASNQELMNAMRDIYSQRFADLQRAKTAECPYVGAKSAVLMDTTAMRPLQVAWRVIESTFAVLDSKIAYRAEFTIAEISKLFIKSQAVPPRKKHSALLRTFIPEFVTRANSFDGSQRGRVRDGLASVLPSSVDEEQEMSLFAAQIDAPYLIDQVNKILASVDEDDET